MCAPKVQGDTTHCLALWDHVRNGSNNESKSFDDGTIICRKIVKAFCSDWNHNADAQSQPQTQVRARLCCDPLVPTTRQRPKTLWRHVQVACNLSSIPESHSS